MAVGKKYLDGTTFVQLAMALSLMRPELQGFVGQNTTPPMPVNMGYPQNLTGVVPYNHVPSTTNFNFNLAPKESNVQHPLNEFLDWHTSGNNQFDTDAVAMLFNGETHTAPRETRASFSTELESGYSSDGGRSPSAISSVGGSPQHEASYTNTQAPEADYFGAAGFTPTEEDLLKSIDFQLEDYIDLDAIYEEPPQKKAAFLPEELPYPKIKTEPLPSPDDSYRKFPSSPQEFHSPSDPNRKNPFEETFNFEEQFFNADPFSIDFAPTEEELQEVGPNTDPVFDLDSFAVNLDDLPLDIFDPKPTGQQAIENKHDSLLPLGQEPVPIFSEATATRNDSGFPSTESLLPQATRDWQSHSFPLLPGANIKQEKPEIVSVPSVPASTSTRFTPSTAPKDFNGARPAITAAGASHFPASEDEIVDMSINEFGSFLETLSEPDAQKARDIRRRGKNKVAARLCRKRKIDVVSDIEDDIQSLRKKKEDIIKQRQKLLAENAYYKKKVDELQDHLFQSLRDESGRPLSSKEYTIFQGANGSIYVGKNIDSESKKKQNGHSSK